VDILNGKPTCSRQDSYAPREQDPEVGTLEDSDEIND